MSEINVLVNNSGAELKIKLMIALRYLHMINKPCTIRKHEINSDIKTNYKYQIGEGEFLIVRL